MAILQKFVVSGEIFSTRKQFFKHSKNHSNE